jgi:hypothetical protein
VGARITSDIVVGGQRVQQRQRRDLLLPDQAERHAALVGGLKQGVYEVTGPRLWSDSLASSSRLIGQGSTSGANLRPGSLQPYRG